MASGQTSAAPSQQSVSNLIYPNYFFCLLCLYYADHQTKHFRKFQEGISSSQQTEDKVEAKYFPCGQIFSAGLRRVAWFMGQGIVYAVCSGHIIGQAEC